MAASSTSRFCLVSKEDIERLIDNAIPDKIFTKTIRNVGFWREENPAKCPEKNPQIKGENQQTT
jgi:hypothetical protein